MGEKSRKPNLRLPTFKLNGVVHQQQLRKSSEGSGLFKSELDNSKSQEDHCDLSAESGDE